MKNVLFFAMRQFLSKTFVMTGVLILVVPIDVQRKQIATKAKDVLVKILMNAENGSARRKMNNFAVM